MGYMSVRFATLKDGRCSCEHHSGATHRPLFITGAWDSLAVDTQEDFEVARSRCRESSDRGRVPSPAPAPNSCRRYPPPMVPKPSISTAQRNHVSKVTPESSTSSDYSCGDAAGPRKLSRMTSTIRQFALIPMGPK